jgi:hypothetical protein
MYFLTGEIRRIKIRYVHTRHAARYCFRFDTGDPARLFC